MPAPGLTATQRTRIQQDLAQIKQWGYELIRIITFVKANDPAYATSPDSMFFTFPKPTDQELTNFKEYLQLIDAAGLQHEVVLLMPDPKGIYYQNGVTGAEYKTFVDAIWPALWTGKLNKIYVGGDLALGTPSHAQNPNSLPHGLNTVATHRQWISEMWPYLMQKCATCFGIAFNSSYGTFWDSAAEGIQWVKSNLSPQPTYFGAQYYPSSPAAMRSLGFVKPDGSFDWRAAAENWVAGMSAAAGGTPFFADEIGLDLRQGFSTDDQAAFFTETLKVFNERTLAFNVWEYADHPGYGLFGLVDTNRTVRPAAQAMQPFVTASRDAGRLPGIQYLPPETPGLQFILPGGM